MNNEKKKIRTPLAVQWLRLRASTAAGAGLIPGLGSSTCRAVQPKRKNQKVTIQNPLENGTEKLHQVLQL